MFVHLLFIFIYIDWLQIESKKLDWNVTSKVGSLDNAQHKPGGGEKKVSNAQLSDVGGRRHFRTDTARLTIYYTNYTAVDGNGHDALPSCYAAAAAAAAGPTLQSRVM